MKAAETSGAIEARGLQRRFGPVRALDGVDFQLASGESLALFGPNGAGKTTLIRILSLGLHPGAGRLRIAGLDPQSEGRQIRSRIGVIGHRTLLYDDLTAQENLEFFAALYGVEDPADRARRLLDDVGLSQRADDTLRTFSRGMQQRVSLARALVHDPSIVLLDEPFTGLDPQAAGMLCNTLALLREQRRTVVLVTHDLRQGLALCERWALLDRGRIVDEGRSEETEPARFEADYLARLEPGSRAS